MKLHRFLLVASVLLLTIFTISASAATNWDKDDHEIFELQSALEKSEGKGATFYSILNIPRSSNQAEIKRAYRKKSLELHPDKNLGVAGAQQRFERLGLVYKILRDGRKDRYDHFLSKGFPKWRQNGYFYERYRPGLGSVVVGIVLFSMMVEVGISRLTSGQERTKIERLKMSARLVAWGPRYQALLASLLYSDSITPALPTSKIPTTEKKVRVPITGFPTLPAFPSPASIKSGSVDWDVQESLTRSVINNPTISDGAPIVECLVHETDVLLLDKFSGDWIRLDEDDARPSQLHQTWPFRLVSALVNKLTGKHEDVLAEVDDELEEIKEDVKEKVNGAAKKVKKGGSKKNK
ncbi:related to ERJ5 - Type I membrane protein preserves the folding capacity of the endoplasmic reticulum [Ustilago trichophora]|uniref:Related to ERJ5 - Type I membrane protein preserves the folding capacity of the endoplasmic reticulum n=1 Tax=Ustilago trichophora TaxID=86804 RepID=A0A5C3DR40_9BASI|nr:related to ERJ5 - Type I membrane protein preserves the folding capacity of the endoplasmic reticulum [Ustilago trichophora]